MKKRILALLLCVCFALSGCGNTEKNKYSVKFNEQDISTTALVYFKESKVPLCLNNLYNDEAKSLFKNLNLKTAEKTNKKIDFKNAIKIVFENTAEKYTFLLNEDDFLKVNKQTCKLQKDTFKSTQKYIKKLKKEHEKFYSVKKSKGGYTYCFKNMGDGVGADNFSPVAPKIFMLSKSLLKVALGDGDSYCNKHGCFDVFYGETAACDDYVAFTKDGFKITRFNDQEFVFAPENVTFGDKDFLYFKSDRFIITGEHNYEFLLADIENAYKTFAAERNAEAERRLNAQKEKSQKTVAAVPASVGSLSASQVAALNALSNTSSGYGWVFNAARQSEWDKYGAYTIGDRSRPVVYLTFDCGYEYNNLTDSILDTLASRGVKAVFFVTMSYVKANPDKVRRMINEGHTVGNHSVTHPVMPNVSLEKAYNEIMQLDAYMQANFGYKMTLFRFPTGASSERTRALVNMCGYKSVFWSFAYNDWDPASQPDINTARAKILGGLQNGNIYLLHAVSQTNTTLLGEIIDNIRQSGYSIELFS